MHKHGVPKAQAAYEAPYIYLAITCGVEVAVGCVMAYKCKNVVSTCPSSMLAVFANVMTKWFTFHNLSLLGPVM